LSVKKYKPLGERFRLSIGEENIFRTLNSLERIFQTQPRDKTKILRGERDKRNVGEGEEREKFSHPPCLGISSLSTKKTRKKIVLFLFSIKEKVIVLLL
jgi:hypothetical protein